MTKTEILAPAGSMQVLEAAIAAGADAAYLGMRHLNARNGAKNFTPDEIEKAVNLAHAHNAKIYLTLNTDLCQRELGLAARTLAVAEKCHVDAVLIRDPALLVFKDFFPGLDFHFSTQAGISSSKGVEAARKLGISRAVLAREMTFDEIKAANAVEGIETEAFVQGAMCFSCSGRCLLSSWGGGRSGNRGACTSPCRVPWKNQDNVEARPMSMLDMSVTDWVDALAHIGVASLKIEGRLKSPSWVSRAVSLYRHSLDHTESPEQVREEASTLGDYTGRDVTDAYLRGDREALTATSGRASGNAPSCNSPSEPSAEIIVSVSEDEKGGTVWLFSKGECSTTHRTPPQRIANPKRATTIAVTIAGFSEISGKILKQQCIAQMPPELSDKLLPKNAANNVADAFTVFLRSLGKEDDGMPRGVVLPPALEQLVHPAAQTCAENTRNLSSQPNRARMAWNDKAAIQAASGMTLVLECAPHSIDDAEQQAKAVLGHPHAIAALPQVLYEYEIEPVTRLVSILNAGNVVIEVNSWDGWQIASSIGARMEAGPGLAVLNSAAAEKLHSLGCMSVTVSQEIDKEQLADLCSVAKVPLSIIVYDKPALMTTRAVLPPLFRTSSFSDTRNNTLLPEQCGQLTILRPATPYDWRCIKSAQFKAANIVLGLHGINEIPSPDRNAFLFNLDRRLR